ncbi:MAG: hypothetical protein QXR87_06305 [Candidatus Hadarchaeales archaeon]
MNEGKMTKAAAWAIIATVLGLIAAGLWLSKGQEGTAVPEPVNGWYYYGKDELPYPEPPEGEVLIKYWVTVYHWSFDNLPAENIKIVLPVPLLDGRRLEPVRVDRYLNPRENKDFVLWANTIQFTCTPVSSPYEGLELTVDRFEPMDSMDLFLYYFVEKGREKDVTLPKSRTENTVVYLEWVGLMGSSRQTIEVCLRLHPLYKRLNPLGYPMWTVINESKEIVELAHFAAEFLNYGPGWYSLDAKEYLGPVLPENFWP